MLTEDLKIRLHKECLDFIEAKIAGVQKILASIADAKSKETKSSAGDKFETGRAMLQIEEENHGRQLVQFFSVKETLDQVARRVTKEIIGPGNLIITEKRRYYLSTGLGKIKLDNIDYFCISPESPIGQLLLGRQVGDEIVFNKKSDKILEVL